MTQSYTRGDMYYADLGQGVGSEQNGYRPVLIIQNNTGNQHSPTVIIAAITSKTDEKPKLPTHYYMDAECGLQLPSVVLLEQLRTIDKGRLESYIGRLPARHIQGVDRALAVSIGLPTPAENKMVLCLCSACARNFRDTGTYSVRRIYENTERDTCTYCNRGGGLDYEIMAKR